MGKWLISTFDMKISVFNRIDYCSTDIEDGLSSRFTYLQTLYFQVPTSIFTPKDTYGVVKENKV